MMKLTDEILIAYADGSLPDAERREVAKALSRDPAARKRTLLLRATGLCVREAYEIARFNEVPQRLVEAVRSTKPDVDESGSTPSDVTTCIALFGLSLLAMPGTSMASAPLSYLAAALALLTAANYVQGVRVSMDGETTMGSIAWGRWQCAMAACSRSGDLVQKSDRGNQQIASFWTTKGRQPMVLAGKSLTP